jgi:small subunit ribosomal protein S20
LANSRQAAKRARQAEKRRQHNASRKSNMRTLIKRVLKSIENGNKELASKEYISAVSIIDRLVNKNIIHKNKAARHKSRLNSKIKALQG